MGHSHLKAAHHIFWRPRLKLGCMQEKKIIMASRILSYFGRLEFFSTLVFQDAFLSNIISLHVSILIHTWECYETKSYNGAYLENPVSVKEMQSKVTFVKKSWLLFSLLPQLSHTRNHCLESWPTDGAPPFPPKQVQAVPSGVWFLRNLMTKLP